MSPVTQYFKFFERYIDSSFQFTPQKSDLKRTSFLLASLLAWGSSKCSQLGLSGFNFSFPLLLSLLFLLLLGLNEIE